MFYSKEDIEFYENNVDFTATRAREARIAQNDEQATQNAGQTQTQKIEVKRRRNGFLRIMSVLVAAVLISLGSIAVYDTMIVKPALSKLTLSDGAAVEKVVFEPVSYGNKLTVPEIVERAKPSVVAITVQLNRGSSSGSGVIMSEDGYIITNQHVVEGGTAYTVRLSSGAEHQAQLVGADKLSDLAVLKIEANGLKAAEFGDSDKIIQGEIAVAIGNPLNMSLEGTVTQGIISAVSRQISVDGRSMTFIQSDAAINRGNSGGALVNGNGQVIGINTAKVMSGYFMGDVEGLGFAIPINGVLPIAEEMIANGFVSGRPSIGISVKDITASEALYSGVPQGILVYGVVPQSGAANAGLQAGDIITGINGARVLNNNDLTIERNKYRAGDTITLSIYRNSATLDVRVTLGESAQ